MGEALEQFEQKRIELDKKFITQYRILNEFVYRLYREYYTCKHCGSINPITIDLELNKVISDDAAQLKESFNRAFSELESTYLGQNKLLEAYKTKEEPKDE